MKSRARGLLERIEKKMRRGHRGDPIGTVAFYGPTNRVASKVVVSILSGGEIDHLEKWLVSSGDVRDNDLVMRSVVDYLERHGAVSFVVTPGIFGCPHEEGIDYAEGEACPQCPFWADRDRGEIFDA